jgi:hypothetical protein
MNELNISKETELALNENQRDWPQLKSQFTKYWVAQFSQMDVTDCIYGDI